MPDKAKVYDKTKEIVIDKLMERYGLSITNNHAFKMSLNSNVLTGKLNLPVAKRAELLRHNVETNMKYYTYATKDDMNDLVDLFNAGTEVPPKCHKFWQKKKALKIQGF